MIKTLWTCGKCGEIVECSVTISDKHKYSCDGEFVKREWVSLDELTKLRNRIKDNYDSFEGRETEYIDGLKHAYEHVILMINEFFPSPDKSLNASKRLGTRCGSGLKQSVESPNRRNENNQEINSPQISTGISPKEGRAEVQKVQERKACPDAVDSAGVQPRKTSALPKHYCCKHRFSAHNKDGCTSPLCDCKVPFGGFVKDKRKVR